MKISLLVKTSDDVQHIAVHTLDDGVVRLLRNPFLALQVDQVPGLDGLGLKVEAVVFVGWHDVRDAPVDDDAVLRQILDLARVVGDQLDGVDLQRHEHVRRHAVLALVVAEAQGQVGLHRVVAVLLQARRRGSC